MAAVPSRVLDVACGRGRHARWFEARGHRVTAIDRDAAALSACGASETFACDLEGGPAVAATWPVAGRSFDVVIVTNYLHRPLFPRLLDALAPGGVLLYETFATGNGRFGKPGNPAFLLAPGELLLHCASLDIVAYEDGLVTTPRLASIQRICAVRGKSTGGDADRHPLSHDGAPPASKSAKIAHPAAGPVS